MIYANSTPSMVDLVIQKGSLLDLVTNMKDQSTEHYNTAREMDCGRAGKQNVREKNLTDKHVAIYDAMAKTWKEAGKWLEDRVLYLQEDRFPVDYLVQRKARIVHEITTLQNQLESLEKEEHGHG